jgi:hypothetical protein
MRAVVLFVCILCVYIYIHTCYYTNIGVCVNMLSTFFQKALFSG